MQIKKGDTIKIIDNIRNKKMVTVGTLEFVDSKKITIRRIFRNESKNLVSFNLADLADINKKYYLKQEESWLKIKFKITGQESIKNINKREGCQYGKRN